MKFAKHIFKSLIFIQCKKWNSH